MAFKLLSIKLIYIRIIFECNFLEKDFRIISAYKYVFNVIHMQKDCKYVHVTNCSKFL